MPFRQKNNTGGLPSFPRPSIQPSGRNRSPPSSDRSPAAPFPADPCPHFPLPVWTLPRKAAPPVRTARPPARGFPPPYHRRRHNRPSHRPASGRKFPAARPSFRTSAETVPAGQPGPLRRSPPRFFPPAAGYPDPYRTRKAGPYTAPAPGTEACPIFPVPPASSPRGYFS